MASSGSFNTGSSAGRYLTFKWWINSQSIENNSTTIGWELVGAGDGGWVVVSEVSVNIDGSNVFYRGTSSHQNVYVGTVVASGTKTIKHNADGSRSFSASVSAGIYQWAINKSGSGSWTLTSIPRAATISSAPNFTDEDNPKITYSNPAGSAVTSLKACISFDGSKDDIPYRDISKSGTSYTFNLTDAERETLRRGVLSGSNSRTVKFYVTTVIGGNTYYSTLQKTLTIANATPTISPTVVDSNSTTKALTGDANKLIRYHSNAAVSIKPTFKKHATAKTYKITNGDKSLSAATGTFNAIEKNSFAFSVTDTRGLSASQTITKTMVDYVHLTCNLEVNRPNALGEMTFKISGNYFNGSFGATNNTLTLFYSMEAEGGAISANSVTPTFSGNTYSIEIPLTGLDYRKKYKFKAWAEDKLERADSPEIETYTLPVFDWSKEDFNFNVPVNFKQGFTNEGSSNSNKILWDEGPRHMNGDQIVDLSEKISDQPNGIVLAWSAYANDTTYNYDWYYQFVPKHHVTAHNGTGVTTNMATAGFGHVASKYVYVYDTYISGNAKNTASGTSNGITYNNSYWVLRYVIGV